MLFDIFTREDRLKVLPLALGLHPFLNTISNEVKILFPSSYSSFYTSSIFTSSYTLKCHNMIFELLANFFRLANDINHITFSLFRIRGDLKESVLPAFFDFFNLVFILKFLNGFVTDSRDYFLIVVEL